MRTIFFCALAFLLSSSLSSQSKYRLEVTFLEIIFQGDSAEYGKGNTLSFDTDGETELKVIDTIGGKVLAGKFFITKEANQTLLAYTLYRQINGQWSAFAQFAPAEPGTLKPYSAYIPNKPSIKNQDFLEIPDPAFSARLATAIYVR